MSDTGTAADVDLKPLQQATVSVSSGPADQHQKSPHPRLVESDGKWVPRIYFLRHKYDLGRFNSQDEAAVAYNTVTSRVQAVLSGTEPPKEGNSAAASDDYFDSVEWRIRVLEKDLVRLRQSEASTVTRLSLADARVRAADEKRKREISQVRDELHAARKRGDQTTEELEEVKKKLRVACDGRDQARTDLDKLKGQQYDVGKERDHARIELDKVKGQQYDVGKERDHARIELDKVKGHLRDVEKERDQARADLDKSKGQLRDVEKEREKHAKVQLALDIKTQELDKAIKRSRQCDCVVEIVEILD